MKSIIWIAFPMLLLVSMQFAGAQSLPRHMTWTVDGVQREALVFEPTAGSPHDRHPLLFAFHGHGGDMQGFARKAALQDQWPEAIVVYPQGLPTPSALDLLGRQPGWQRLAGDDGDRDLKFMDTMLAGLRRDHRIDSDRTYATGFSNGAFFSLLLWSERSNVFAGFVIVGGALKPEQTLKVPRPVLHIAGRGDPLVTPAKVEPTIAEERRVDRANGNGQACGEGCTVFHGAAADVRTYWHQGGHVYPPVAAQMTVTFFKGLQRPAR